MERSLCRERNDSCPGESHAESGERHKISVERDSLKPANAKRRLRVRRYRLELIFRDGKVVKAYPHPEGKLTRQDLDAVVLPAD